MTYEQLDINQKINTKAALQAWTKYSVQHFQADIDKKVYGRLGTRTTKKGVQSSKLSSNYGYGRKARRTHQLRNSWWENVQVGGGGTDRVLIQFMLYGRFLDMGVGRGTSHTDRQVNRMLGLGRSPRTRRAWYSKRKGYEIKKLREILAINNIHLRVDSVETIMSFSVKHNMI